MSQTFRPAALSRSETPDNYSITKIAMERLEIEAASKLRLGSLASAAHLLKRAADSNAKKEFIERTSLAAWWVYRRGGLLRNPKIENLIKVTYPIPDDFTVSIGEIPSTVSGQPVFVSIIENSCYPYAVLGSACRERPNIAALHAYQESLLSWGASRWMRSSEKFTAPRWDFGELHKRTHIKPYNSIPLQFRSIEELMQHTQAKLMIRALGGAAVALIYSPLAPAYSTQNLAQLVRSPEESPLVRTEANL